MVVSRRSFLTATGASSAAAVLLVGCAGETGQAAPPANVTIEVTFKNGQLSPNAARVQVVKGATVTVTVDSEQDLRVHMHGYEEIVDASAGVPVEFSFVADMVGTFELETHDPSKVLAQVVVRDVK